MGDEACKTYYESVSGYTPSAIQELNEAVTDRMAGHLVHHTLASHARNYVNL